MNWQTAGRIIAIAVGAAVLFGLQLGLGQAPYVAVPAGIFTYLAVRGIFALTANTPAK
jgi:hypothetical protein